MTSTQLPRWGRIMRTDRGDPGASSRLGRVQNMHPGGRGVLFCSLMCFMYVQPCVVLYVHGYCVYCGMSISAWCITLHTPVTWMDGGISTCSVYVWCVLIFSCTHMCILYVYVPHTIYMYTHVCPVWHVYTCAIAPVLYATCMCDACIWGSHVTYLHVGTTCLHVGTTCMCVVCTCMCQGNCQSSVHIRKVGEVKNKA